MINLWNIKGDNMRVTMRVLNPLQFVMLYKRAEEISTGVEPWIRLLWREILTRMITSDWLKKRAITSSGNHPI